MRKIIVKRISEADRQNSSNSICTDDNWLAWFADEPMKRQSGTSDVEAICSLILVSRLFTIDWRDEQGKTI